MTLSQYRASDPTTSVWVAASAGTGKTKVLTDRVLRLLLAGVHPGKIICLTFTKAAAAEMANRIQRELGKWVLLEDHALTAYLQELTGRHPSDNERITARRLFAQILDVPDGLKIHNVHSFCQNIIRKFPLEAGITPHFKVAETQVTQELVSDVLNQMMKQKEQLSPELNRSMTSIISHVYEGKFHALLKDFVGQRRKLLPLQETTDLEAAIADVYALLEAEITDTRESLIMNAHVPQESLRQIAIIMVETGSKTDQESGHTLLAWLGYPPLERVKQFESYVRVFVTLEGAARKQVLTQSLQKKHALLHEVLLREQQRVIALSDKIRSLMIAKMTSDLLRVGSYVLKAYTTLKAQRALLDYDDLILIALRLLKQSDVANWVLYKLDGGIDHLLVDEAQDTSAEQWEIIEALSEEFFSGETAHQQDRTLFVVGDDKQSIYSFQGADPRVFNQMQRYFAAKVMQAKKTWHPIALDRSFRSTEAVLTVVDALFADTTLHRCVTSGDLPVVHAVHRTGHGGRVEVWPITEPNEAVDVPGHVPWEMPIERKYIPNTKDILAEQIASTIADWLTTARVLPSKGRPVQPGDIMILVQRRDTLVESIIRYLKLYNVPVSGLDRMRLTEHIAVMDMMALGNFLLLPQDDLTLAVVLKTPLIGMDEEALFSLSHGRTKNLWDTLYFRQDEQEIFKQAYLYLAALLSKVDRIPPFELFAWVLDADGGRKKMVSRLGVQANDPLDEFLALALDYEMLHIASMQGFMRSLESGDIEIKRDMDQGQNQVRIMTVHGSKGLQAPIIFLPDATHVPQNRVGFLWEGHQLIWSPASHYDNHVCEQLKQRDKAVAYDEYIRLLYVALTRAEDELYIAGYKQANNVADKSWYRLVEAAIRPIAQQRDGRLCFECPQLHTPLHVQRLSDVPDQEKTEVSCAFINTIPQPEMPDFTLITPSDDGGGESETPQERERAMLRGTVIHRLLQHLPAIDPDKRSAASAYYLKKFHTHLTVPVCDQMGEQVLALLQDPHFNAVFSVEAKAEVPVVGRIGKYEVSGVIDRLVVLSDRVLIVDYKTNRIVPKTMADVPASYLKQMAMYLRVLEQIYPDKIMECAILWISEPSLQKIELSVLKNLF